jgi:virginiamycin A acetyltransferase
MTAVKRLTRPPLDLCANLAVLPLRALYAMRLVEYMTISQTLAMIPGQVGKFTRRAWYRATLDACGRNLVVHFGAAIRTAKSRIGNDCYIGPWNWIGWVDMGDDFMSGNHVTLLSGAAQHRFEQLDVPMREQMGSHQCLRVGHDVWVGSHAAISADVAPHSVVGTGAVVTKTFGEYDILGGVPAAPIGSRLDAHDAVVASESAS